MKRTQPKPKFIRRIDPDWRSFWLLTGATIAAIILGYFLQMGGFVSASNITQAKWGGQIEVRNLDSPALTNVTTNFTLNTTDLITRLYVNASVNNTAIRGIAGADLPYMPGLNSTSPWIVMVPSLTSYEVQNNPLYTGGTQSMASKIRYFPGAGGMTTADNTTLEMSSNGTYEIAGMVNMSVSDNIISKDGAVQIKTDTATSNITAAMSGGLATQARIRFYNSQGGATEMRLHEFYFVNGSTNITPTGFTDPDGEWTNEALIYDADTATYGYDTADATSWSSFVYLTHAAVNVSGISFWARDLVPATDLVDVDVYYGTIWVHVYQGIYSNLAWVEKPALGITATVTGQSTEEKTIRTGIPFWSTGNVLDLDNSATANVNLGAIYNSATKLTISAWFKPDTLGASPYYIWSKASGIANYMYLRQSSSGAVQLGKNIGAGGQFATSANTVTLGVWNHVIASISNTAGMRIRLNGGTAATNADTTAAPNAGTVYIGFDGDALGGDLGFDGKIANVAIFTDDLTVGEETALASGLAPADATDYWFVDEGAGNTVYSYGSSANNGTKGAGATWATGTYTTGQTGRLYEFGMQVNSTIAKARYIYGASVADTANDWITGTNYVMPYIEYQKIWVNGVLQQHVYWQLATTFTDQSGASPAHNATPTFRSTGTTNVTAQLVDFAPINPPAASSSAWGGAGAMVSSAPTAPPQMYTELAITLPFADAVNVVLDWAAVPRAFFWFPAAMFQVVLLGGLAYWMSRRSAIVQLVVQAIAIAGFALGGVWTFWMVPIYVLIAVTVITVKRLMGGG